MIESQFIRDILDLLLDGEDVGLIKSQLDCLSVHAYDYTNGNGCFITFSHSRDIFKYRLNENRIFNGVEIESQELAIGADATLFMEDGIIDYLEIWSFDGNYPNRELKTYTLKQVWTGSSQRIIEK